MSNTELWDRLGKTDPKHTKPFKRSGGFSGTSIKPIYSYRRMTEEFGSCGEGWGINEPSFQVVPGSDGEVLVYCTASIWYGSREKVVFGVGGDKAVVKQSSGLRGDDEAFKKAFTDGITNALKMIGVGADVHMGMFDDDKYVNTMLEEFGAGDDKAVSDALAARMDYVAECGVVIKEYEDAAALLGWWSSEDQKRARRSHQLEPDQVNALKQAVMNRRDALTQKVAA